MNKEMFDGFNDIKADRHLILKTKNKMLKSLDKKSELFPYRKIAYSIIPIVAVILALTMFSPFLPNNKTAKAQDLHNV
jgi:hypothetical protein